MKISSEQLIGLPVYTESNRHLGSVASVDIDIDTNGITHYHVRTGVIKGLWHEQLVIAHQQVISISAEKMLVEDSVEGKQRSPAANPKLANA